MRSFLNWFEGGEYEAANNKLQLKIFHLTLDFKF